MSTLIFEPRALPVPYPVVTPGDRLALTLCIAVIVHAMIILGVSFAPEPPARLRPEGLEVTLVAQKAPAPPDNPEMLAQANAAGGGELAPGARPSSPIVAPVPAPAAEIAAAAPPAGTPAERSPLPFEPRPPARTPQASTQDAPRATPAPAKLVKPAPVAKLRDAPAQRQEAPRETAPTPAADDAPPAADDAPDLPSAQQLITRSFAMASLHAELQQKLETKASRPRTKYVSASTQEFKYAAYMEAWRQKVERIGNLNYPDEARRRKLSGALLLDVSLKPDGTVLEIIVRRSSGHRVLDDAAVRIVELAGPFAPFPEEIRREVDILHVTRTWKFLSSETFQAQ